MKSKFKIDKKIVLCLILFIFLNKINLYILILFFAFIHELAHIFIAKKLGFKIGKIELMPFGFFCELKASKKNYKKSNIIELKRIIVAIVGPLSNIAIIFLLVLLNKFVYFKFFDILVYSNFLICILNLIPIFPLDGGRILRSCLNIFFGEIKANKYIDIISRYMVIIFTIISSLIILYLKNILIVFILVYLWILVINEHRNCIIKEALYNIETPNINKIID